MEKKRFLFMAILIACLVLTKASALADPNDVAVSPPVNMRQLAPLTEEEMAAAVPLLREIAIEEGQMPISRPIEEQPVGELVVFPSRPGETGAKVSEPPPEGDTAEIEPTAQAYTYPFPFTRFEVFHIKRGAYRNFPYKAIGQLFFNLPGGGSGRCTASVAQGSWVWTAGHCVHTPGLGWHTNFTFVPGARGDKKAAGKWRYDDLAVSTAGWISGGELCFDIGAVRFKKKKGKTLERKCGSLGFMANASIEQHWNEFGYPADPPFDGTRLIQSQSSFGEDDPDPSLICSPRPIGVGNDMTGGSSGGPWIISFSGEAGATNFINSVNSYKYINPNQPDAMYGPYFGAGSGAVNLWDFMTANPN